MIRSSIATLLAASMVACSGPSTQSMSPTTPSAPQANNIIWGDSYKPTANKKSSCQSIGNGAFSWPALPYLANFNIQNAPDCPHTFTEVVFQVNPDGSQANVAQFTLSLAAGQQGSTGVGVTYVCGVQYQLDEVVDSSGGTLSLNQVNAAISAGTGFAPGGSYYQSPLGACAPPPPPPPPSICYDVVPGSLILYSANPTCTVTTLQQLANPYCTPGSHARVENNTICSEYGF